MRIPLPAARSAPGAWPADHPGPDANPSPAAEPAALADPGPGGAAQPGGLPLDLALDPPARPSLARRVVASVRRRVMGGLGLPAVQPFGGYQINDKRRAAAERLPEPRLGYAIVFTPRSGSSRLHEILAATGALGEPGEVFNPAFVRRIGYAYGATDMADYVRLLRRHRNRGGVWGFEATPSHIQRMFGTSDRFRRLVAPDAWLWLLREDIVLQAVSISRMTQTRIAHDTGLDAERLRRAEAAFAYHGAAIRAHLGRLRDMERDAEAMWARHRLEPLRLSYERVLAVEPAAMAAIVARHLGEPLPQGPLAASHRKLGTDKNAAFAQRFRAENASLIERIERERAPMLARLADLTELGPGPRP